MDSMDPEVNDALSVIQHADLPHPSGALLSSFITEALDPQAAADYLLKACHAGHGPNTRSELLSLVDDWTYIVDSGEPITLILKREGKCANRLRAISSNEKRQPSACTKPRRAPSYHPP